MSLTVIDQPSDGPLWIGETVRLVGLVADRERRQILDLVASAPDADLVRGSDDDWGLGQIATHLLIVERGVLAIALRLARGEAPGPTGQPRPDPKTVTREAISSLAGKSEAAMRRLATDFPSAPDVAATGRHPYFGDLNCFGWLLTMPNHYVAHLESLRAGTPSAL